MKAKKNGLPGKLRDLAASLSGSKTLRGNFLKLSLVMFVVLLVMTLFIYNHSNNIVKGELKQTNTDLTQNVTDSMDNLLMEMRYVTATLGTNQMVQFYFAADDPSLVFNGFYERIQEQLAAYVNGFDYIHSIYLYSPKNGTYFDVYGNHSMQSLTDTGWLDLLNGMKGNIGIFPRKESGVYPYVITIINRVEFNGGTGAVVLNLNLHQLPFILGSDKVKDTDVYIVDNQKGVLYSAGQENLPQKISLFPQLSLFHPHAPATTTLVDKGRPFIITQIPSKSYDWNYVTVTNLKEYVDRLSGVRTFAVVFFFTMILVFSGIALFSSMSFYRPIQRIAGLLDSSEIPDTTHEGKDIKAIAEKIVGYVQTNSRLSQELQARLNMLNETRVWALQSQINPHFLSNTLNLIQLSLPRSDPQSQKAAQMIIYLGKILHFALDPTSLVSLERETEYARLFLAILNERYDDVRIETGFDIAPDTASAKIPKLILQPLIENAVYHGMDRRTNSDLRIKVSSSIRDIPSEGGKRPLVALAVEDNGLGIRPDVLANLQKSISADAEPSGRHIGLKNVARRLRLLFGDEAGVEIESSSGRGTRITLIFPMLSDQ